MTNPRDTILLKPGTESKVYQLGQPRVKFSQAFTDAATIFLDNPPIYETDGVDVQDWHSVKFAITSDYNTTPNSAVAYIKTWRYYSSKHSEGSPLLYNANVPGTDIIVLEEGEWVGDIIREVRPNSQTQNAIQEFTVLTSNCDKIFFQLVSTKDFPIADVNDPQIRWLALHVYGITPKTADGVPPSIVGPDYSSILIDIDADVNTDNVVYSTTAAVAMNVVTAEPDTFELVAVTCHLSAAPTTSELFRILKDANDGAAYDTELFAVDPATYLGGIVDIVFRPTYRYLLENGDQIRVQWTNTDLRTYGLQITVKR